MQTILLIDDDPDVIQVLRTRFQSDGYRIITAENGERGLEIARAESPQLILLDVLMPRLDGYTFICQLRADPALKAIPVIVLSDRAEMEGLFRMEGVRHYIVKPFDSKDVSEKVKTILPPNGSAAV